MSTHFYSIFNWSAKVQLTRKHSGRMRTTCLPTVSHCSLCHGLVGGWVLIPLPLRSHVWGGGEYPPLPLEGTWHQRYPPQKGHGTGRTYKQTPVKTLPFPNFVGGRQISGNKNHSTRNKKPFQYDAYRPLATVYVSVATRCQYRWEGSVQWGPVNKFEQVSSDCHQMLPAGVKTFGIVFFEQCDGCPPCYPCRRSGCGN